uniref:Phosphatidylinositol 3-kinase catalytic subunit type 3 n=1 Tax=Lepeophtheirus salmonis TaxID=72036 RepID=A0A0K2T209_LEPSM
MVLSTEERTTMISSWLKDFKIRPDVLTASTNPKTTECPELEPFIIAPSTDNKLTNEDGAALIIPENKGKLHDDIVHKSLFLLKSKNTRRRKFAVYLLKKLPLEKLDLYLPQLVQALRLEDFEKIKEDLHLQLLERYDEEYRSDRIRQTIKSIITKLFKFSDLRRVVSYENIVKLDDVMKKKEKYKRVQSWTNSGDLGQSDEEYDEILCSFFGEEESQDLSSFLIEICTQDAKLSNSFYWYLMIECESQQNTGLIDIQEMYIIVLKRFLMKLEQGSIAQRKRHNLLQENFDLINKLSEIFKEAQETGGTRMKKTEKLITKLNEYNKDLYESNKKFLLPTDPTVTFDRFIPEKTVLFKAENMPCKMTLRLSGSFLAYSERHVIYKNGDDLRQDAIILQLIKLFDDIWKDNGLDLKLTPYVVIPTSPEGGFLEYIESKSIANILGEYGSLESYFLSAESGSLSHETKVDNFTKSCAGYSIITYVLGIGDRHLDNLLITPEGKLFHVDFAYILGFDPKPLPPPIKLTKDMIDVMGGSQSKNFTHFVKYCQTAFTLLRRNSALIIELFASSSVPSTYTKISPTKLTNRLNEKFFLEKSEIEASKRIENIIKMSSSAVLASLVEKIHGIAQSMRS